MQMPGLRQRAERQRRWLGLLVTGLLVWLAGCSSDGASIDPQATTGTSDESSSVHVVIGAEEWELREALHPRDLGSLAAVQPTLDWYAEYERLVPVAGGQEGRDLRLSGHRVGLTEHRRRLPGFRATEGEINGRPALWGVGPHDRPAAVTIAFDEHYTIMALSHSLGLDDLRRLADQLMPVSQAEWTDHGGRIVDCLPTDPDCEVAEP